MTQPLEGDWIKDGSLLDRILRWFSANLWRNALMVGIMLWVLLIIAGGVMLSAARASELLPTNFIGEWCYSSQENNTSFYTLPSWTEGGICKKILSIEPYGFYGESHHCEPVSIRNTKDTAPSGTAYIALVIARCQPDGPVTIGKLRTFELNRYKGSLTVTVK